MEVTANTNSDGIQLETCALLGSGRRERGRSKNFVAVERAKRVVDEMKEMLVGMPAMASSVALEVVRLLKSSKTLESGTTAHLVVNMDGLRTEAEVVHCAGFEYRQDEEGKPFICRPLCYKGGCVGSCAR
jgi:hypothetical protein